MSTDPNTVPNSEQKAPEFTEVPPPLQTSQLAPAPNVPVVHRVFVGPEGIRAGWRFALYLLMFMAVLTAFRWLLNGTVSNSTPTIWKMLIAECVLLSSAVLPALVMGKIEKHNFGAYGLPKAGALGRPFWTGTVWGIVALTVLMVIMRAAGLFYFGSVELHGLRIVKFAAFYGLFFVLVGLAEEFLLRGYSQFTLAQGTGFWPAAVLLSTIFGAVHLANTGEGPTGAATAALIGLFFCLTLRRTGNLWFAVGFHASWDWGETFLYSVPNSGETMPGHLLGSSFHGPAWLTGGTVGPEGSVLAFIVVVAVWGVFDRLYPNASVPVTTEPCPAPSPSLP